MALKSFLVSGLIVMLVVAAPAAEAQLLGIIGSLLNLIHIEGRVLCGQSSSAAVNGTITPVFPNAQVQLTCGGGNIMATTTTNAAGIFSILLNPLQIILPELLSGCNLVVSTPLSNCNPAFTAGAVLQSPLHLIGNTFTGLFNLINLVPEGFQLLQV